MCRFLILEGRYVYVFFVRVSVRVCIYILACVEHFYVGKEKSNETDLEHKMRPENATLSFYIM